MRNSEYWAQRFVQLEKAQHEFANTAVSKIDKMYQNAIDDIERKVLKWYQRLADNNKITLAEAKRFLVGTDLKEFKWDVKDYIAYAEENALDGKWAKELENASAKFHISKLEALKIHVRQSLEVLFSAQFGTIDSTLKKVYKSGYYKTAYELQKGFNIGFDIVGVDQSQIEKIIAKPWAPDGYNFSERIWKNKNQLINTIHNELTQNILTGADPQKAINAIAKKMNTSKFNAGRLVMTEEAYFSSAAQKDCFSELGVEQYEIVATLDTHTSDICRNLDGKHYPMSEYKAGVTAPPFHVYCRSTTAPYFDDDFGQIGQRAARDENGKTYYVPDNMTYKEWYDKYVEHNNKMSSISNNWIGAEPIKHTKEELDELIKYAENKGIKLYKRREFDGDIDLLKAEIDTVYSLRKEYGITDPIMLGWKPMNANDFGETSKNHHEIWINELALRSREITEKNLSADNYLVANTAEGIAAHEMGHIISGKIKNGKTGIDIFIEMRYNVDKEKISVGQARRELKMYVSEYATAETPGKKTTYNEVIPEFISMYVTSPNSWSSEFVKLLKEAIL